MAVVVAAVTQPMVVWVVAVARLVLQTLQGRQLQLRVRQLLAL
ncbi:hypothetical protein HMPREF9086_4534 [Enterobacter hormaechei ATCC 49162]|nr:hypothetical protein HMPREF9086_4534 [Enterobacter hormaechei ATCC 49162]